MAALSSLWRCRLTFSGQNSFIILLLLDRRSKTFDLICERINKRKDVAAARTELNSSAIIHQLHWIFQNWFEYSIVTRSDDEKWFFEKRVKSVDRSVSFFDQKCVKTDRLFHRAHFLSSSSISRHYLSTFNVPRHMNVSVRRFIIPFWKENRKKGKRSSQSCGNWFRNKKKIPQTKQNENMYVYISRTTEWQFFLLYNRETGAAVRLSIQRSCRCIGRRWPPQVKTNICVSYRRRQDEEGARRWVGWRNYRLPYRITGDGVVNEWNSGKMGVILIWLHWLLCDDCYKLQS